ncbi:MAG: GrxA family glutaredoxin [Marinobacter sp.]|uniref:GrxA family glutaredoxin n=1 Tax=Marinobacter sp. TaxID=50741 RepID=UPI00299F1F7A|nr:GrxA family glutaredoxin [Marinobacter sp.]MDX1755815.1 GrxA family glutaredoxin [Marinobacter sp.]
MEHVSIFGRPSCGFCVRAQRLCELKELPFRFIDMMAEGITKADLEKTIGKPVLTVPQIFVGDQHVGGYTEFAAFLRQAAATAD